MPTKVIDASAVAAILFNEPEAALVAKKVGSDQDYSCLTVPHIFKDEFGTYQVDKNGHQTPAKGDHQEEF